jgi:hypothetical protein
VVAFDDRPYVEQDFTDDSAALGRVLKRLEGEFRGQSAVFDAIYYSASNLLGKRPGRKIIILDSDGVDTGSRMKDKDMLRALGENGVEFYVLSRPGAPGNVPSLLGEKDRKTLETAVKQTGGRMIKAE